MSYAEWLRDNGDMRRPTGGAFNEWVASNREELTSAAGNFATGGVLAKGAGAHYLTKAGEIWATMSKEDKEPWVIKCEEHRAAFEAYRQSGGYIPPRKVSKKLVERFRRKPVILDNIKREAKNLANVPEIAEMRFKRDEIYQVLKVAAMLRSGELTIEDEPAPADGIVVKSEKSEIYAAHTRARTERYQSAGIAPRIVKRRDSLPETEQRMASTAQAIRRATEQADAERALTDYDREARSPSRSRSPVPIVDSSKDQQTAPAISRPAPGSRAARLAAMPDVLKEADRLGLTEPFAQLSVRPDVIALRADARSILQALKDSRGLVPPAERALLAQKGARPAAEEVEELEQVEEEEEDEDLGSPGEAEDEDFDSEEVDAQLRQQEEEEAAAELAAAQKQLLEKQEQMKRIAASRRLSQPEGRRLSQPESRPETRGRATRGGASASGAGPAREPAPVPAGWSTANKFTPPVTRARAGGPRRS